MRGFNTTSRARTVSGKPAVRISTEVEIEESVDVDVTVPLEDILEDIIDSLDEDQAEWIAQKAGIITRPSLEGEQLKRHLCDLAEVGYQSSIDTIMNAIIDKL
jgi:hypothetical protein